MTRWLILFTFLLSACAAPTTHPGSGHADDTPSPQEDIQIQTLQEGSLTPTPLVSDQTYPSETTLSEEPERKALSQVAADLESQSFWWSSNIFKKEDKDQKNIAYVAEFLFMAGATETAEILIFASPEEAISYFGTTESTFNGFPSNQGGTSSFSNGHYGDVRYIEWLSANRIFRASTSYLSTYQGEARDPLIIAESLFLAADQYDLLDRPSTTDPSVRQIPDPSDYRWTLVADGFKKPLDLTHAGDNRLFVVEQAGLIRIIKDDRILSTPFLDLRDRVNDSGSERGLLGLAFHPNYVENGFFFLNYTGVDGHTVISRFQISSDPNQADPDSESILLRIQQPYANHNGGGVKFGPDGMLFIGTGDGGSGGDPLGNGQRLDTLLGKLLRIDVDGEQPYAIPPDNPFVEEDGLPEIWAYGLRNPWRFSFDRMTGDLYIADVGQNIWEEVNFQPADSPSGVNYGWNLREGQHPFSSDATQGLTDPVAEYSHEFGCSVTGGVVVRDPSLPSWNGIYLYGDYCTGMIWGLLQTEEYQWIEAQLFSTDFVISSFGEDSSGGAYLVDYRGGIYRLAPLS